MKISNWLKAGRSSKKSHPVILNTKFQPSGSIGDSSWTDYVLFSFYSKENESFIRLDMTVDEARDLVAKMNKGLEKFNTK